MNSKNKNVFLTNPNTKRSSSKEKSREPNEIDSESEQVYMSKRKYFQRLKDEEDKYVQCWKEGAGFAYKAKYIEEEKKAYAEAWQKEKHEKEVLTQKVRTLESELHNQKARIKQAQIPDNGKSIQKNVADINKEVEELYNKSGLDEIKKLRASLGLSIE